MIQRGILPAERIEMYIQEIRETDDLWNLSEDVRDAFYSTNLYDVIPDEIKREKPQIYEVAVVWGGPPVFINIPKDVKEKNPKIEEYYVDYVLSYERIEDEIKNISEEMLIKYPKLLEELSDFVSDSQRWDDQNEAASYFTNISDKVQILHPDSCIAAVKGNPMVLEYICDELKQEHPDMCIEALECNSAALPFVPDKIKIEAPYSCMGAVEEWPELLEFVPDIVIMKWPEECVRIVADEPDVIQYMSDEVIYQIGELWIAGIESNPELIEKLPTAVLVDLMKKNPQFKEEHFEEVVLLIGNEEKYDLVDSSDKKAQLASKETEQQELQGRVRAVDETLKLMEQQKDKDKDKNPVGIGE